MMPDVSARLSPGETLDLSPGQGTHVGVLLPHFGAHSTWERLFGFAPRLEQLGYRSVWVRDHINFHPHGFEAQSNRFLDPFITLNTIGMLTRRMVLGTATVITFRHPLVVSQLFGSLAAACGGRIIAGIGVGTPIESFQAVQMPYENRWQACRELAHILRLTWSGEGVSYDGKLYQFQDVTIDPHPPANTPIWYGGSSDKAIKRVLEYADGWLPGRSPRRTFDKAIGMLREAEGERGMRYGVGVVPVVSIARDRETALSKINVEGLLKEIGRGAFEGPFETVDDLKGVLIAGSPADCAAEIQEFIDRGVDHLVLDLRLRMGDYEESLEWIAKDVLPLVQVVRRGDRP
jgi:alkanesulfonate monooxygenase SsuD/methylene tetrahydromethanopterin reductase-like flavin-dependent oxidoreductase (luciferase family)